MLRNGDFLTLTGTSLATVRTPTDTCHRAVEHVHDQELCMALVNLVRDAGGITHDELTTRVARLYGWTRRGPDIATRLHTLVTGLLAKGILSGNEHNLTVPGPMISAHSDDDRSPSFRCVGTVIPGLGASCAGSVVCLMPEPAGAAR